MTMNEEEIKTKETLNQYLQDWGILLEEQMDIIKTSRKIKLSK